MPTINQLIRKPRKRVIKAKKNRALTSCPQRRGVCVQVKTATPKKTKFSIKKNCKS